MPAPNQQVSHPIIPTGPINHAALNCRDVARSVAFYRDLLGFREIPRPGFDFDGAWLYREGAGVTIHLIQDAKFDPPRDRIDTRKSHLAFSIPDAAHAAAVLRKAGVEFIDRPLVDLGYQRVFLMDPDGNVLELGEWPVAAAQSPGAPSAED